MAINVENSKKKSLVVDSGPKVTKQSNIFCLKNNIGVVESKKTTVIDDFDLGDIDWAEIEAACADIRVTSNQNSRSNVINVSSSNDNSLANGQNQTSKSGLNFSSTTLGSRSTHGFTNANLVQKSKRPELNYDDFEIDATELAEIESIYLSMKL